MNENQSDLTLSQAECGETRARLRWNFSWGAASGVLYESGVAFVDTGTVLPSFLANLTGSSLAVGAAETIRRFGWLVPQLFVAHYAQSRSRRIPIYLFAGFGRAVFIALLAGLLFLTDVSSVWLLATFFIVWIGYSFVSGIAGVPYNDVVGRVLPSARRTTFLAVRFTGGGILAAGAGLLIRSILIHLPSFPQNFALIFGVGAIVLVLSTAAFGLIREPAASVEEEGQERFAEFLRAGWNVLKRERRFRFFTYYQLTAGLTTMAFPFYVVQARQVSGLPEAAVGVLLAAQQVGSVVLNPLWGAWGDRLSKLSLLNGLSWTALVSPALALAVPPLAKVNILSSQQLVFAAYAIIFFFIGALLSGETTGYLAYLMEISPDARRADYSGYMNTFVAPARLLPLVAGVLVDLVSFRLLFVTALLSVVGRLWLLNKLGQSSDKQRRRRAN